MSSSREGLNPLRPYYFPPSMGLEAANATSSPPDASSAHVFGSSARDLLSDLDYSDYLENSPSVSSWIKDALDRALWKYTSLLTAQPFDVAKTILQAYVVPGSQDGQWLMDGHRRQSSGAQGDLYDEEDEDEEEEEGVDALSSDDESSYFTSTTPAASSPSNSRSRKSRRHITDRMGYIQPSTPSSRNALKIKNPSSLMDVLSQLWTTSGPTSPWKATNATFIYSLLLPTLNTFIRSLLSAIVGLPEDDISSSMTADILTSTSPIATLVLSFISTSLSALILSPIDTARTLLILTPVTHGPRSLIRAIRQIPTPNCTVPPHLVPITILHSSLPNFIMTTTPLFLKSYLSLDPVLNPSMWNLFTFMGSGLELAVRFPLETVLRRAQIATFTSPSLRQQPTSRLPSAKPSEAVSAAPEIETIVPTPRTYRGIVGTMWGIVYEEGVQPNPEAERAQALFDKPLALRKRQGQGIHGLYRGWRIGMWGIAGIWGASFLGSPGAVGEDGAMPSGGRF
ncbi:mitochondrial carrier domain-containing protein [Aspergillus pseudonomiae]|uniref:Mitochondrial carrier domain-containing protein n=1 Tax=Aspergillus pseudonomiae TaxID=1506151 RepID=A0A5N7D3Z2_9EURO|nr:mitochondrial carrier domain-containing protein [Aspergillus pseudonomiae]KAB8265515.1 mitochondrial carrier domain-containing protein [Aspergillus pseudonomiae]KAE8401141.1 mitochondrial carrier domain-containing protein [Aspergillus pseudonomiae]